MPACASAAEAQVMAAATSPARIHLVNRTTRSVQGQPTVTLNTCGLSPCDDSFTYRRLLAFVHHKCFAMVSEQRRVDCSYLPDPQ
eukprot:1196267-Prorocentrum_minimum.AAC.6